jgi:hypothetical protein
MANKEQPRGVCLRLDTGIVKSVVAAVERLNTSTEGGIPILKIFIDDEGDFCSEAIPWA